MVYAYGMHNQNGWAPQMQPNNPSCRRDCLRHRLRGYIRAHTRTNIYRSSRSYITYYAPWGNLAIYYRDFGYSSGLVILGKIDSGMEALDMPGSVRVTVELDG
jgi:hypothetical protein